VIQSRILGWLAGVAAVLAVLAGAYFYGRMQGRDAERAVWTERQIVAERAARQTETDLAALAAKSAARTAEKERLLHDQANRQTAAWRDAMARVRDQRIPAAVGVQLDAAGSLPAAAAVAEPPRADPDAQALDKLVGLADTLDTVRTNYSICAANISRLSEARDWYDALRERVNAR
jgi:antitoxin component of MazEF toxin-antitoxin module